MGKVVVSVKVRHNVKAIILAVCVLIDPKGDSYG